MKEFLKWLGVNEKIAKLAIWLFVIMVFLIITNALLDSIGLPYYKITADNLVKINTNKVVDYISATLLTLLNFYSVVFLVFRLSEFKKILPYSILYLIGNIIINTFFGYIWAQLFIIVFNVIFFYMYSNKNIKYLLYCLLSIGINVVLQYVWYLTKAQFINLNEHTGTSYAVLGLDFFIFMTMIIATKEIYVKKRSEKNETTS